MEEPLCPCGITAASCAYHNHYVTKPGPLDTQPHAHAAKPSPAGHGDLTVERAEIFEAAIDALREPSMLRELANAFANAGLPWHADRLRRKAILYGLSAEAKNVLRQIFLAAQNSCDPTEMDKAADVQAWNGAFAACEVLRKEAARIRGIEPHLDASPVPVLDWKKTASYSDDPVIRTAKML